MMTVIGMLLTFVFFVLFTGITGMWYFFKSDAGYSFSYMFNHFFGTILPDTMVAIFHLLVGAVILFLPQYVLCTMKAASYKNKKPGWVEIPLMLVECAVFPLIFSYLFQWEKFDVFVSAVTYFVSVCYLWGNIILETFHDVEEGDSAKVGISK